MYSVLERVVLCAGEIVRETEGSREMGIVDSLRWVVMERMGQRDEGWRRDGSWTRRRWRRVAGTACVEGEMREGPRRREMQKGY
ncbi:hypothetical protein AAC387_Pa11g0382 [Persea americana]